MEEEVEVGCARPTGGPVGEDQEVETDEPKENGMSTKEVVSMIKVGKKAPDFTTLIRQANLYPQNFRIIWASGCSFAFTRETSPLSEPRKFRQLPRNIPNFKNWMSKSFP